MNWFLLLTLIMLPLGLLLLGLAQRGKAAALNRTAPAPAPNLRTLLLWKPWQELLLGFIFTFSGLYFARRVVSGAKAWELALATAALIALFSAWGAYSRFHSTWNTAELPAESKQRLLHWHRCFCLGLALLWLGLLSIFAWQLQAA
ncbi:MAG: hypothetical protein GX564_01970 [Oligosphaeraceae bacterium]|nr:hypothetical protein [Oligosphaeraceae bacterium]